MKTQPTHQPIESILAIVLAGIIVYLIFHFQWILITSLTIGLLGIISKQFTRFIHLWWIKITKTIGTINAYVLLSIIFMFILFPISLIYRLFGKGSSFFNDKKALSTFTLRNSWFKAEDLKNPW